MSLTTTTSSLLESHVARMDSVLFQHSDASDFDNGDHFEGDERLNKPKSELLLDPKCRPRWFDSEGLFLLISFFLFYLFLISTDVSKKLGEDDLKYDISSIIHRPAPKMKRPLTVGGLDKKSVDNYWKLLKNPNKDGKLHDVTSHFR
jgi:hypothetical protein